MASIPLHRHPDVEARSMRTLYPALPCACCGLAIFKYDLWLYVRVVGNGAALATRDEVEPPHLDMGFLPVCVPCAPSIPEPFRCNAQDARGGF